MAEYGEISKCTRNQSLIFWDEWFQWCQVDKIFVYLNLAAGEAKTTQSMSYGPWVVDDWVNVVISSRFIVVRMLLGLG